MWNLIKTTNSKILGSWTYFLTQFIFLLSLRSIKSVQSFYNSFLLLPATTMQRREMENWIFSESRQLLGWCWQWHVSHKGLTLCMIYFSLPRPLALRAGGWVFAFPITHKSSQLRAPGYSSELKSEFKLQTTVAMITRCYDLSICFPKAHCFYRIWGNSPCT